MVGCEGCELACVHKRDEIGVAHLLDLATELTDEMTVWLVAGLLILHLQPVECVADDHPGLDQQLQCVVDGCLADMVCLLLHALHELLDGEVRLKVNDAVKDGKPLWRLAHLLQVKKLVESLDIGSTINQFAHVAHLAFWCKGTNKLRIGYYELRIILWIFTSIDFFGLLGVRYEQKCLPLQAFVQKMELSKIKYHLLALAVIVVWGVSFVNTKVLLDYSLNPTEIFIYRSVVAYTGLVVWSRFKIRVYPWRDEALMALLGLLGGTCYFIFENTALKLTLVTDVAILVALNSLFTTLLAAAFLREERFTWVKLVGSIVAFAGVGLLTFTGGFVWGDGLLGDLLAILAAAVWAVYSIILKRINKRCSILDITRKVFFYGVLFALPLLQWQGPMHWSILAVPAVAANLLFLSLICSMVAFFIWGEVTVRIGAILTANYLYLSPVVSVAAAWLIYGETIGCVGLLGCLLVLVGIILVERH